MRQWIHKVRALNEQQRKRVFILAVVVVFAALLGIWILVIQFGFIDIQSSWMSGTHTYSASGTPESTDLSPLREKWDQAKNALGNAWNNLGSVLGGGSLPIASNTSPLLLPASSTSPKTASSTASSANSL